ncbi:ADP-ribosylation factor GTPase-activating protein [Acrasis kona]|uniref:ADP-ribosylation factor GTPase-activating protein n=1 Tax=Acrasis kona TaxID=1008807 RepID=A0AAW2ZBG8_9EUKA
MSNAKEQAKFKKILSDLSKKEENRECADCTSQRPDWASVNLGLFICIRCSGLHRSLGTHISFVRSAVIDDWKQEQIDTMLRVGNAKAKAYWEATAPERPKYSEFDNIEQWINDKYVRKLYIDKEVTPPHSIGGSQKIIAKTIAKEAPRKKIESPTNTAPQSPQPTSDTTSTTTRPKSRAPIGSTGSSAFIPKERVNPFATKPAINVAPAQPVKPNPEVDMFEEDFKEEQIKAPPTATKKKKTVKKSKDGSTKDGDSSVKKKKKKKVESDLLNVDSMFSSHLHVSHSSNELEIGTTHHVRSTHDTPNSAPTTPFTKDPFTDESGSDSDEDVDEVFSNKNKSNEKKPQVQITNNMQSKKESIMSLFNTDSPSSKTSNNDIISFF